MTKKTVCCTGILLLLAATAHAQYAGWRHSGSLYILTTPEGANLPATASEEGFPLLVRLHKDFFDFSQAKANGEDIRFSTSTGDAAGVSDRANGTRPSGTASIWVRIPTIKGNARQEIKMYLGQGRRGQRVQRIGRVQRVQRLPQRLAHERSGEG